MDGITDVITEHIHLSNSYQEVKKVYSISILYFDIGKGADYLYVGQNNFVGVHTKDNLIITEKEEGAIVQRMPSEIFPTYYLVRVNNFNDVAKSPLEEWMRYLKEGIINEGTKAPGLREARQKLQYYSMSDADRHAYDEHVNAVMIQNDVLGSAKLEGLEQGRLEGRKEGRKEGIAEGRKQGIAEGIEQGIAKGKKEQAIETARKMKEQGLGSKMISIVTGLSEQEINQI